MHRRALLASVAAATAGATAGCGYRLTGPIEHRSFDICDGDCDWADRTPEPGREPIVVRDPESRRIVVYGNMLVGSGSCDRAVLQSAQVSDGKLSVVEVEPGALNAYALKLLLGRKQKCLINQSYAAYL